jgi:hypothetical protein
VQERDTAWVWLAEKERPAVVLEVHPELVRVAYGTSETHEWPVVVVDPSTRQGRAFPLREITHFYGANTSWELPSALRRGHAPCAWELLFAIRKLVESYDAGTTE